MLSNVTYFNDKDEDLFAVVWKDLTTKDKANQVELIADPKVPIYFTKPDLRKVPDNKYMAKLDTLERHYVKPSQIARAIAREMGPKGAQLYRAATQSHDWKMMKEIFRWPFSFGADYPPEFFYRIWWMENCKNDYAPYVKTAFSDIEADIIQSAQMGDIDGMVANGADPINIISIYFKHENEMHVFALIPNGSMGGDLAPGQLKQYVDLMANWDGFEREIHDTFDKPFGKINYLFHWYPMDKELIMLIDYFALINRYRPDFVGFWNMPFDMPYMAQRSETLGANPADVICDPAFPIRRYRFKKDTRHFEFKESGDFLYTSTVPQYVCLMRNYAKHRKQMLFQSYSLDAISEYELGQNKIKYGEDGVSIKNLAYVDLRKFFLYNIKDTLLTKQIDEVTGDLEYTWIISNDNFTNYDQIFSPSLSLRCIVYNEFLRQAVGEY
jgi:DNA polymerase elongation subunit (family B)